MRSRSALLTIAAALAMSSLLAPSKAGAQVYVGGSIGASHIDDGITEGLITSGTVDGSGTGFKAFGGYQFNRHLAVEGAYVDLGNATYSGDFFGLPVTGGKVKVSGVNVAAVGIWPIAEKAALFGKLGLYAWEAKASDTTAGMPFSGTKDGVDPSFALGVSYEITRNLVARAEGEFFKLDNANASLLSIGLLYRFGR